MKTKILWVVLAVILFVGAAFLICSSRALAPEAPGPRPIGSGGGNGVRPNVPSAGPITISGDIVCLPKKGDGPQTMECAYGLHDSDGRNFGLKNLFRFDPDNHFTVGERIEVTGEFSPEAVYGPGNSQYDVVGMIDLTSVVPAPKPIGIPEVVNGETQTAEGTVEPGNIGGVIGLSAYPDMSLTVPPSGPVDVKFLLEHRSAFNGKVVSVRGTVVGVMLGESACPPDRGACAMPSVFLAESSDPNRDPLYDLRVLMPGETSEGDYVVGKTVVLRVIVDGNNEYVVARLAG